MREKRLLNLVAIVAVAGCIFLPVAAVPVSQSAVNSSCGCSLVDKSISLPSYISLVKLSSDKKTVMLRLVNNTDCVVEVEARGGGVIALPMIGGEVRGNAARERDGEM